MMHVARAELEFNRRAVGTDQRGVQGLVAVHLGDGDVVLELAGHRAEQLVQRAQRQIALGQRMDHDAEAVDVQHVRERLLLVDHLAVDAEQGLFAAADLGFDARGGQGGAHGIGDLGDDLATIAARGQHGLVQHLVAVGVHRGKAQVLQFAEQQVKAQPVRDGRVDVQGLAGDAAALFGIDRVQRAHVVQPVGQLDEDDAHVARHRQQHFPEAFSLLFRLGGEIQAVQLGQAIDQFRDFGAESFGQLVLGDALVFHHVVQQGGRQRVDVELPARADFRDGDGMRDVGRSAGAELAQVRLVREAIGFAHALYIVLVEIAADDFGQRRQRGDRRSGRVRRFLRGDGRWRGGVLVFLARAAPETGAGTQCGKQTR